MKKLNLFFALVLGLFIISCGNSEKAVEGAESDATTEEHQDHTATTETDEHQNHTAAAATPTEEKVELPQKDASGKWVANPETTAGIKEMAEMLQLVSEDNTAKMNRKIYQKLGVKLKEEMDGIFNKCTMTGESHEALHTYLLPMVDMVKTIGETDQKSCLEAAKNLTEHLKKYDSIFAG